jgi:hypothetical protein
MILRTANLSSVSGEWNDNVAVGRGQIQCGHDLAARNAISFRCTARRR